MRISIFREYACRRWIPGGALPALAAVLAATFASCVKSNVYVTPHPLTGAVEVVTDWSGREQGTERPASYVVRLGEKSFPVQAETAVLPELFAPGSAGLYIYNVPAGMTVDGLTASVDMAADGVTIEPLPGRLFTFAQEVTVNGDDTLRVTAPMRQRTRGLRFELTVTEGDPEYISEVRGVLGGVARTFDIASSAVGTEAAATAPAFVRQGDKITASANLPGVVPGAGQILEITLVYTDGQEQTVRSDLSGEFADFGSDMTRPLLLTGNLHAPTAAGAAAVITDWESGLADGYGDVVAD